MPDRLNPVLPQIAPVDEEQFHHAFVTGLHRLVGVHGKAKVARALGCTVRHLANIYAGTLPSADRIWNLRTLDPTALDEIANLQGSQISQAASVTGADHANISALVHTAAAYFDAMADGSRNHRETLELADLFRPLIAGLLPIVAEADRIKGLN